MGSLEAQDWRPVVAEWNRTHGLAYQVRPSDVSWNFSEQDLVRYRVTKVATTSVIVATATPQGIAAGLSQPSLWLALWGEIPEGREPEFLDGFRALGKQEGKTRLVLGADEFHLVPGVPVTDIAGERLKAALQAAKFEGSEAGDFIGPAKSPKVDAYLNDAVAQANNDGWRFLPVETRDEEDALYAFLAKEFAGRWTREFAFWRSRQDTRRAYWHSLKHQGDEILGFARMAVRGKQKPLDQGWSPGALRLPLRTADDMKRDWLEQDACLGPIGVASSQRGKGAGRVLLGRVLESLQAHNAGRVCIDWTNAFKYYYPLGFEISRQYWTAWKSGLD
jgi:predicted GNAT family N-acyltransferase